MRQCCFRGSLGDAARVDQRGTAAAAEKLTLRAGLPSSPILSLLMRLSQLLQYTRTSAGFVAGRPSVSSWRTVTCRRDRYPWSEYLEYLGETRRPGDQHTAAEQLQAPKGGGVGGLRSHLLSCEASIVQVLLALWKESTAVRAVTSVHRRRLSADGELVHAARARRRHSHARRTGDDRAALQTPIAFAKPVLMSCYVCTSIKRSQQHHQRLWSR